MNQPCRCSGPGQCERAHRKMSQRDYELCSGNCPPERPCTPETSVAMRRLWDTGPPVQYREPVVPINMASEGSVRIEIQEPGLAQKMVNFKSAYQKWVEAGKPLTPPEERARRWAICEACEFRDKQKNTCKWCGCPLEAAGFFASMLGAPAKIDMATEGCPALDVDGKPAPRWLPLVSVNDGEVV